MKYAFARVSGTMEYLAKNACASEKILPNIKLSVLYITDGTKSHYKFK